MRHSKISFISRTVVGRDRLKWRRHADGRLFLIHRKRNPLVIVEPDSKHTGMYRVRFPDGGLSDMVNLTRAKDAAFAFALRSLNVATQETPPDRPYVRAKRAVAGEHQPVRKASPRASYRIACGRRP